MSPTQEEIKEKLKKIIDPVIGKSLDELNHINDIFISDDSVSVTIIVNNYNTSHKVLKENIHEALKSFNFSDVKVNLIEEITKQIPASDFGPPGMKAIDPLPNIKNVIAIASNKGGVGKSTVAANIVSALKELGAKVALLDLDLYGPNIPTMFGVTTERAKLEKTENNDDTASKIMCIEKFGIPMMSVGFILPEDDTAVVLRAPLANKLIMEFLNEVKWPDADYLVVDMPPGTGDIQLTLAQQLPNAKIVFVTTPQQVALDDVYKGIKMFTDKEINIPVLGIIENMSYFEGDDGKRYEIFGKGGGQQVAKDFDIEMFGEIPIVQKIREHGDNGKPLVLAEKDHPITTKYLEIAEKLSSKIAKINYDLNEKAKHTVFEELDLM